MYFFVSANEPKHTILVLDRPRRIHPLSGYTPSKERRPCHLLASRNPVRDLSSGNTAAAGKEVEIAQRREPRDHTTDEIPEWKGARRMNCADGVEGIYGQDGK